jgi:homocysteine S-methyltransferase
MYLTDGGIETTLIFLDGLDLPCFAAFDLMRSDAGRSALERYFRRYADVAREHSTGLVLESATWRASHDWGDLLGYSATDLDAVNRAAIAMVEEVRREYESAVSPIVISGCVGPRGDGYVPANAMSAIQAADYHAAQITTFADSAADLISAITMNYVAEAIGVAQAARAHAMPCVISFTVETDGRLPTGQGLADAIAEVDAETAAYPAYYMVNCAHPSHFEHTLERNATWASRIQGVRANASRMSHAELNEAAELDSGDPDELGRDYRALKARLPRANVFGGCCGTDHRHVDAMARACGPSFR